MPCYQTRTNKVALEAADVALLARAMENVEGFTEVKLLTQDRIGFRFHGQSGSWRNGQMTYYGDAQVDQNAVRRSYSKEAIKATAKKQGWQLRFRKDGKIVATRRRFS